MYHRWSSKLPDEIEVHPIQYPGHSDRMAEGLITNVEEMVDGVLEALCSSFIEVPYSLFGYSMGALIAFETAREMRRRCMPLPSHLFLAARRAPDIEVEAPALHKLPDADFLREIGRFEGTPEGFFREPSLVAMLLPVLRADFELCESYRFRSEEPLDAPIVVMSGVSDGSAPPASMDRWKGQTASDFESKIYPGGHFFLKLNEDEILRQVEARLLRESTSAI